MSAESFLALRWRSRRRRLHSAHQRPRSGRACRHLNKRSNAAVQQLAQAHATANIYSDLYSDELDQVATNLDQLHATEVHTPTTGQEPDESNQQSSA